MSEVNLENDVQTAPDTDDRDLGFEPVCIDVPRIYDSCGAYTTAAAPRTVSGI